MPQLHLYLPEELASKVILEAQTRGISVSRFLAELVKREIRQGWSEGYFDEVVGQWQGEALQRSDQGELEMRDLL